MVQKGEIAMLKAGDKTFFLPPCANCGGVDFKLIKTSEDGYLLIECQNCRWHFGVGSSVGPSLLNYLTPLIEAQAAARHKLDKLIKGAKNSEEKERYKRLLWKRLKLESHEIRNAWAIIREKFGGK